MGLASQRAHLGLSLLAYAGMSGPAARELRALHGELDGWLLRVAETRGHEIAWGPISYRPWWQPSAAGLVAFVTRPRGGGEGSRHVVLRAGGPVGLWDPNLAQLGWLEQEPWVWARSPGNLAPAVCGGLLELLDIVREATAEEPVPGAGQTLAEALASELREASRACKLRICVVGHGLGGALALLVALWLHDTQGDHVGRDLAWDPDSRAKLHCQAFANPAIGNADFAAYVSARLGANFELVHNDLDCVPGLFELGDDELGEIYGPQLELPPIPATIVRSLRDLLERHGVEYEQPSARALSGALNLELPPSFFAQAEYQHLHAYAELLGLDIDLGAVLGRPAGIDGGPMAQ